MPDSEEIENKDESERLVAGYKKVNLVCTFLIKVTPFLNYFGWYNFTNIHKYNISYSSDLIWFKFHICILVYINFKFIHCRLNYLLYQPNKFNNQIE